MLAMSLKLSHSPIKALIGLVEFGKSGLVVHFGMIKLHNLKKNFLRYMFSHESNEDATSCSVVDILDAIVEIRFKRSVIHSSTG